MGILEVFIFIFACIASYLLGGVSVARFVTKKSGGINNQGSGNPGTMNMLRNHGMGLGLFTLLCDALKGAIPALFGLLYFGEIAGSKVGYLALFLFGFFAVVGHIFPVYYKFKGGKGIATTFGVFMVADPISTSILFGILFVTLYFIKIGSVVSLLFVTIDAIVQLFRDEMSGNWLAVVVMLLMIVLDIYAHRSNIVRIIEDKEIAADLQEALNKDLNRLKKKKEEKLDKVEEKSIKKDENVDKDHKKSQKTIEKTENTDNKKEETSKTTNE